MEKKRAVLFGAGRILRVFMEVYDCSKIEITAVCDNSVRVQGTDICGIKVCRPEEADMRGCDCVIITSSYFEEMKRQALQLGAEKEKIINFHEVYQKLSVHSDIERQILKDEILFPMLAQRPRAEGIQRILDMQERNLFINARIYINAMCGKEINSLEEAEFQVFSQFGQDGIIQWLIHNVELGERTFVEFGVENYMESNTRFLMMNNNWKGLVIDGNEKNIDSIKNWKDFWKYDLTAVAGFITKDNINDIITKAGFRGDIGILGIDIDGNDYWVLNSINCVKPRILICEYNDVFGPDEMVSVPYDEYFYRTDKHYSNLYWGSSLKTFCGWAEKNGYCFMGCNSAGNDAFFVRKDCISENKIPKRSLFAESKYRQSRDEYGRLTYLRGDERLKAIKEMELVDLAENSIRTIADIYQLG